MKYREMTFRAVINSLVHHWPWVLVPTILFMVVGAGAGFLFGDEISAPAAGSAQPLTEINLEEILKDRDYFGACVNAIKSSYTSAKNYCETVQAEKTLTQEEKDLLKEQKEALETYWNTTIRKIDIVRNSTNKIYIIEPFMDELAVELEIQQAKNKLELMKAEAAVNLLKTMDAPSISSDAATHSYEQLLSSAAEYGNLKVSIMQTEHYLDLLKNHRDVVIADANRLDIQIQQAAEELNLIQDDLNKTIEDIAIQNHFNAEVVKTGENYEVHIFHKNTVATPQEGILILTIFCGLVGLCCGWFLAICREAKSQKNDAAQQSEKNKKD